MNRRLPGIILMVALALLAAGCSAPVTTQPVSLASLSSAAEASESAVWARATPAETIAPDAAYALPLSDGIPIPDPAAHATAPGQVLTPSATVLLTTPVLLLLRRSVEGTMIVEVTDLDTARRQVVARIIRFNVPYVISQSQPEAVLTLPKGTLVRVRLPDTRRGEKPVPVTGLLPGDTAALRVRFRAIPGGTDILLLSVDGEGGA